jgi:ABC-type antimicrobial peptide transport system permease subunit
MGLGDVFSFFGAFLAGAFSRLREVLKSLAAAPLAICLGAAAFALFIGYVLSECSGVTVKKLTDRGQLLLLLGGLLLGRLLLGGLLGLFLRSHGELLYRLFGSERLTSPPKTSSI